MQIPNLLKNRRQWIVAKKDKTPVSPKTKHPISVKEPKHWMSYEEAGEAVANDSELQLGFAFAPNDKSTIVGLDIDLPKEFSSPEEQTNVVAAVQELVESFGTYAESSPSGRGIHAFVQVKGRVEVGSKTKVVLPGTHTEIKIELYSHSRYFTVTGNKLEVANQQVMPITQAFKDFIQVFKKEEAPEADKKKPQKKVLSPPMEDDEVLAHLRTDQNLTKFIKLHDDGNMEDYADDHSSAVAAWVFMVAFYTQDKDQIDRLFKESKLCTGKWREGKWELRKDKEIQAALDKIEVYFGTNDPETEIIKKIKAEFGTIKRDIFTGDAHINHEDEWKNLYRNKAINDHVRALLPERGKNGRSSMLPHIARYQHTLQRELLLAVPEWDKKDRIAELCACVRFKEAEITTELFTAIIKEWCARAWTSIFKPGTQNRCPILSGPQGAGKDVWIETLVGGYGQYQGYLMSFGSNGKQRDYIEQMEKKAVLVISEFDKVHEMGTSILKELVTNKSFEGRTVYTKESQTHHNRTSFIAACNPQHVLVDFTGNRRFAVFYVTEILWDYDRSAAAQAQIVAQMKALALQGFRAKAEYIATLESITERYTPEDPMVAVLDEFDSWCLDTIEKAVQLGKLPALEDVEGEDDYMLFTREDIDKFCKRVVRDYDFSNANQVLGVLKQTGRQKKYVPEGGKGTRTFYGMPHHIADTLRMKAYAKAISKLGKSTLSDLQIH